MENSMSGLTLAHLDKIIGMRSAGVVVPEVFIETGTL